MRVLLYIVISVVLPCGVSIAEDFAAFVIPAKTNPDSAIGVPAGTPIEGEKDRLTAGGGHFYRGRKQVRLWGVNLSFGANLPNHEDAPKVAARLAAAGVNAVRCHHMDSAQYPRGLWNAGDGRTIEPKALDRLDFFIDQLARRGICVDLNLHVGRTHSRYLGLPQTPENYDKVCSIFTPALIEAQKKYAREILTHINKYRNVRYADDPAVAIVEITNENSLFMWSGDATLRSLPEYYAKILQGGFNEWLKGRYGSDEKLRAAWSEGAQPLGGNLLQNADFLAGENTTGTPQPWQLELHAGCGASASPQQYQAKDALRIEIVRADETSWHIQFKQQDVTVQRGQYYSLQFEAAADEPRQISCGVTQAHDPWNNLGLSENVRLGNEWKKFRFGFVAKAEEDNARVSFSLGGSSVSIYLAGIELRPGGRTGLQEAESIRAGNIAVFADSETNVRTIDRMRFLADTEKAYFDGMRNFIRKELGCRALVTGTIVFGPLGLYGQSDMDFIDAHAYWQHPRFPGRPWDGNNWLIDQKAMSDNPDQATLFHLAAERLLEKPFTVSEYNHPAPLDSQAECVPMVASFAAAQDWDGVWLYTYSHSEDSWDRQILNSYFDVDTNPAKWGFMRAGTAIFRDRGVAPVNGLSRFGLADSADVLGALAKLHLKYDRDMFGVYAERGGVTRQRMLDCRYVAALSGEQGHKDVVGPAATLEWSVEDGKGIYVVNGRGASIYVGRADRFEKATKEQVRISGPEFAALTVTSLDRGYLEMSREVLVTACGRCENTGMKFSEDRRTVGTGWGGPPVRIEAVEGTVVLPKGRWECQALGPDGLPKQDVPVLYEGDRGILQLSPRHKTMWYLLTRKQ